MKINNFKISKPQAGHEQVPIYAQDTLLISGDYPFNYIQTIRLNTAILRCWENNLLLEPEPFVYAASIAFRFDLRS
jgi:hypothetical protein